MYIMRKFKYFLTLMHVDLL